MSLNFNKVGKPVAMIKGGKYDKKIIYIDPNPVSYTHLTLPTIYSV